MSPGRRGGVDAEEGGRVRGEVKEKFRQSERKARSSRVMNTVSVPFVGDKLRNNKW